MEEERALGHQPVLPNVGDPLGAAGEHGAEVPDETHLILVCDVLFGEEQQVTGGEHVSQLPLLRRVEVVAEIEAQ